MAENKHVFQRWDSNVEGVPNVRPAPAKAFQQLGRGIRCIEVGVYTGINAKAMFDLLQPSVMVLVDMHDDPQRRALLSDPRCQHVIGKSQDILPCMLPDLLDFAYIDADHDPEPVAADVRNCVRLVRVGGIVGGDDYAIQDPLQSVALGVSMALGGLEAVEVDGYDWWVTVTPEMKERVKNV